MSTPELIQYIKKELASKTAPEKIKERLLAIGWKQEDIEKGFAEVMPPQPPQASTSQSELQEMRKVMEAQAKRLAELEGKMAKPEAPQKPATTPRTYQEIEKELHAEKKAPATPSFPTYKPEEKSAQIAQEFKERIAPQQEAPKESVESRITGKWFAIIGVVAIVFGVGFFLKYAFENNIIGVHGRIILGILGGLVMLIVGDILQKKDTYRQFSFYLSGGGLAILYLSIYSAYNYYDLIAQTTAFIFMSMITLLGAGIALRINSQTFASLAILGGFLTPFLASSGENNQVGLLSYILILDCGILALSAFKKWFKLNLLSFIGTYLVFFAWGTAYYTAAALGPTMLFLTLFFGIFLIVPFLASFTRREESKTEDLLLSIANAAIYFTTSYILLNQDYHGVLGFFFVVWACIYFLAAYALKTSNSKDLYGVFAFGGIGLVLITLAIPIQLERQWITIAWIVEGLILVWTGMRLKNYHLRRFGHAIFVVSAARLLFIDARLREPLQDVTLFINDRFIVFAVAAAACFIAAHLYRKYRSEIADEEKIMVGLFGTAGNLAALFIISAEAVTHFEKQIAQASIEAQRAVNQLVPVFSGYTDEYREKIRSLRNMQSLSLSVIWAVYASILMALGMARRIKGARIFALVLFGIVIGKVFLFDMQSLSEIYRILAFIVLGMLLLLISFLFYKYKAQIKEFILAEQ